MLMRFCAAIVLSQLFASSSLAQSSISDIPPSADTIDENGLSYQTQTYVFESAGIRIGAGGNNGDIRHSFFYKSPGLADESTLYSFVYLPAPSRVNLASYYVFEGKSVSFKYSGVRSNPDKRGYAQTSPSRTISHKQLTTPDGIVYTFGKVGTSSDVGLRPSDAGTDYYSALSEKAFPDGEKWTYTYEPKSNSQDPVLRQVQSSLGPTITLYYVNLNTRPQGGIYSIKPKLAYVKAYNGAAIAGCSVGAGIICNPPDNAITETYARNNSVLVSQVLNSSGERTDLAYSKFKVWGILFDVISSVTDGLGNIVVKNFYADNYANNKDTANECISYYRLSRQEFPDSTYKNYSVTMNNNIKTIVVDNSGASSRTVRFACFNQATSDVDDGPLSVVDENLNTTSFVYDIYGRLRQTTLPEGNGKTYEYDERGNIVKLTINSKSGSNTPSAVFSRKYYEGPTVTNCVDKIRCNKIVQEIDPLNVRREWSWASSGQVLEKKVGLAASGACNDVTACGRTNWLYTNKPVSNGSVSLISSITENSGSDVETQTRYSYDNAFIYLPTAEVTVSGSMTKKNCVIYNDYGNPVRTFRPNSLLDSCPSR